MAISRTAHGGTPVSSSTAGTSQAIATTAAVGESIVVACGTVGTAVTTPTDTAGNSYVHLGSDVTNTETISFWGCLSNKAASPTVTGHWGSSRYSMACETYSGVLAFNNSNTTTNTGSASPATATLPKALGFASSWSLFAAANQGTATWSASTGNLRANIAGAGNTTPGVAIVDNTTTTCAAAESAGNVWAATIVEMFGDIVCNDDQISQIPKWSSDWRAPTWVDEESSMAAREYAPRFAGTQLALAAEERTVGFIQDWANPFAPTTDEQYPSWDASGWRAVVGIDEESEYPVVPPVIVLTTSDDSADLMQKNFDWRAIIGVDEESDIDTDLVPPRNVAMGQFAVLRDELAFGMVLDWSLPTPPAMPADEDLLQQNVYGWRAQNLIDEHSGYPIAPIVVVSTADEPADNLQQNADWRSLFLQGEEQDADPDILAPATESEDIRHFDAGWRALQQYADENQSQRAAFLAAPFHDAELQVWAGVLSFPLEEEAQLTDTDFLPPSNVDDTVISQYKPIEQSDKFQNKSDLDEPGFLGTPDREGFIDEVSERNVDWRATPLEEEAQLRDADLLAAPAIQEEGENQRNIDWRAPAIEDDANFEDADTLAPTVFQEEPIEKYSGWNQIFHGDEETQRTNAPTPPFVELEESEQKNADWTARQYEDVETPSLYLPVVPPALADDDQRPLPLPIPFDEAMASEKTPPAPVIIFTATDDIDSYGRRDQVALQPEAEDSGRAVDPPTAQQDEISEKVSDWRQPFHVDEETQRGFPPQPPSAIQEEPIEKQVDTRQIFHADEETQQNNAPAPPAAQQDEISERYSDTRAIYQSDEETQSDSTPTPPTVNEEYSDKNVDWRAQQSDASEELQTEDSDLLAAPAFDADIQLVLPPVYPFDSADASEKTPPPPVQVVMGFDEVNTQTAALDKIAFQYEDTETPRVSTPNPPTVQQVEEAESKNVDWSAKLIEDDLSSRAVTPPTTQQDEISERNVDWKATPLEEEAQLQDTDLLAPTTQQDEISERNVDWRQNYHADEETQRASAPTPPTTFDDEIREKNVDWSAKIVEDDQSNKAVTPPVTQIDEVSERNVDWRAVENEDRDNTKTPPPPVQVVTGFDEIEFMTPAVDIRSLLHEDTETQSERAPTPPTAQPTQFGITETATGIGFTSDWAAPLPPTATDESEQTFRAVDRIQVPSEDDASSRTPAPPAAQQDEISERNVDWRALQFDGSEEPQYENANQLAAFVYEEQYLFLCGLFVILVPEPDESDKQVVPFTPAQNVGLDDQESFRGIADRIQAPSEDDASFRAPTPPPAIQFEETEQKNVDYLARQYEDTETQRALPPTPPTVQQVQDAEQKNVDWLARQYEDTETQQVAAPPPPVTQIDEISERYVDWQQPWHEDTETQRTDPPTPPTTDDFDHSQMLQYVPMAIPFDEADANPFPPPPPPLVIGAGRDDEELQSYREFTGPYFEAIQEQWIWFSGFIYPLSAVGSGIIRETSGSGTIFGVSGVGQITQTSGPGKISKVGGTGRIDPVSGDGEINRESEEPDEPENK